MGSPWSDLDRPPLSAGNLARDLSGSFWSQIRVVEETESTNADVAAAARDGAPEGLVIVAERQHAGRGRLGRTWESPPRAGLTLSLLLRPTARVGGGVCGSAYVDSLALLPLLTGLALAEAVQDRAEIEVGLKWPNDLLAADERKLGGILTEIVGDAVVIGIGLNVTTTEPELPGPTATSLRLAGARTTDREPLLKAFLRALAERYESWPRSPEQFLTDYRARCATIGRAVRVELPGGRAVIGTAVDIDDHGGLVVETAEGERRVLTVGDVVHIRNESA